ncbi:hypothetical protein BGZ98_004111 [Dissophora globulifera]|nr:hypothetical protein BGZ98_004111 [Dissophora globulifera]
MKIKKTPVKRLAVPPLPVRHLIKTLHECPESEIVTHVEAAPEWVWPRGDLFHWVAVLNRFDDILDRLCKSHELKKAQPKEFSDENRRLVLAILGFSRILLENCTNRNIYASYEQLNDLLHTYDLDVLESCLRLLLRPAQRHSAQRSSKSIFTVSQDRLLALAHSWGNKEQGLDLLQLLDENVHIPDKLTALNFQFYRTTSLLHSTADAPTTDPETIISVGTSAIHTAGSTLAVPTKHNRSSHTGPTSSTSGTADLTPAAVNEGMVIIHATNIGRLGATDHDILVHFVKEYQIPEEHQFSLFNRIRVATGIKHTRRRLQLLTIRLLTIAVMSHALPEAVVVDKFFAFEPDVIQSLVEIVHPDHNAPFNVQTVALFALDGLAHLRGKQVDVLTAVNASASHGVLLYMMRKIVSGLDSGDATTAYPQEFLDAAFAFLSFLISSQSGGSMIISAGIVPVLLKLLDNMRPSQLKNITKSVSILDSLVYGFNTAFTSFCSSDGPNLLVARIKEEVGSSLQLVKEEEVSKMPEAMSAFEAKDETTPIPFEKTALLKAMFKFLLHMMQGPGTQEGLRNLIDTTLPTTLKVIMENSNTLGTAVYAHAINTMASFIHNEPTSLSILQDAKIPQTLLAALSNDIPASTDVVMSIPGAFGAVCLNGPGLEMFNTDFRLSKFFDIFTSPTHVRAFQDSDIASNLGMSVDELLRHQPSLKPAIMKEVTSMLEKVLDMCSAERISEEDRTFCSLQITRAEDAPPPGQAEDSAREDKKESLVPLLIEGAARFCESFFQNTSSTKDFMKAGGIDSLMRFYSLETLPYDLASSPAFLTLSYLIKQFSESNPAAVVTAVVKEVNRLLVVIKPLLESTDSESMLMKYLDLSESTQSEIEQGNKTIRSLITLYGLSGLLSDMFCAPTFSHGRNSAAVLSAFISAKGVMALEQLGQLHRICVWESIKMKRVLQKNWSDPNPRSKKPSTTAPVPGTIDFNIEEIAKDDKETNASSPIADPYNPTTINTKYFNFVLTQTPHCLTPMYQGDSGIIADRCTYLTTMLRLLPFLMLDDRNPPTLQTMVVVSLVKTNGLEVVFDTLDFLWDEITHTTSADEKSKMYSAVEVILSILHTLTSSKLLHDSAHTSSLISKDERNRGAYYFEPHEFLVSTRLTILPKIKALWLDPVLGSCPSTLVRQLIQILVNILKAEGELKPPTAPGPSIILGGASGIFGARPAVPDPSSVALLLDMGFPRAAAEAALTRCSNQIDRATEYLLTHQDIVAAAIYDQERQEAAARTAASIPTSSSDNATGESTNMSASSIAPVAGSAGETAVNEDTLSQDEDDEDKDENMLQQALQMSVSGRSPSDAAESSSATAHHAG